ncbi:tyrosine-type recombinase/integrase [Rouxiella badensis]|uniref:tyrosine-type recombinase/integrase n=1 Tax=Rouxiella badensis TaxID=1646377 RepID=UPI001D15CA66|nr:tyrosine-type recombinase/integrase [Rouxiella badensis]MCC3742081.1 tyrosine-type recombinase/integrase [Rouxiella badensis]
MPLTELQIKKAKPTEKPYTLSDGLGLSILVEPNGSKAWRFRYRFDGKPKMLSLGTYEHVSLADARQKRDESRRLVASGVNPSTLRKEQKAAKSLSATNTFEALTREWYEHRYDRWSASYREEMMDTFEKDVFPFLGFRPIAEIKPLELLAMLRQVESRGATEKVRKVRQRCGEVFRYAIITGRAEYNPAPDLASAMKPHKANNYAHLAAHELPEFLSELNAYTGSVITKIATQLLILTGLRPGEVRRAQWSEIDMENKVWEVPVEHMKMGRPHLVPLSKQAIALLEQIRVVTGRYELIFPGRDFRKPISEASINQVMKRIGYNGRATGHGFRHTMSTILHEKGYNSAWIELQLAHVDKNSIRGTYNHALYLDGRRDMMQWYADYMGSLISPSLIKV